MKDCTLAKESDTCKKHKTNPIGNWNFEANLRKLTFPLIERLAQFLEKAMAHHFSTLAWKIPWMEEPGRLQSMGSLGAGHN